MTLLTQLTTVNAVVFLAIVQSVVKVVLMFIAPLNSFRFLEMNLLNALVTSLFTVGQNSDIETGSVRRILNYRK